uniref:Transposase n=1 Tax=Panagrellus redivivus TaxID=6233 RepID=A0A7E4ZX93_PANRE
MGRVKGASLDVADCRLLIDKLTRICKTSMFTYGTRHALQLSTYASRPSLGGGRVARALSWTQRIRYLALPSIGVTITYEKAVYKRVN